MSTYSPSFKLLEETHAAMVEAQSTMETMKQGHSYRIGFWPSMSSIERTENTRGQLETIVEGTCMRQAYYNMTGAQGTEGVGAQMQDIWDLGSAAEEIYNERFQGLPAYRVLFPDVMGNKLRFQNAKTGVRGEVDLILQHKETSIKFGVEMKSYYGPYAAMELAGYAAAKAAYKSTCPYIRNDNPLKQKTPFPKLSNLMQTMLYLEEFWNEKINLWKIVYVSRDKGPYAEFDVSLGQYESKRCAIVDGVVIPWMHLEGIHERFKRLQGHVDAGTLPTRDFTPEYDPDEVLSRVSSGSLPKWIGEKVKRGDPHRDWQCGCCSFLSKCIVDNDPPF